MTYCFLNLFHNITTKLEKKIIPITAENDIIFKGKFILPEEYKSTIIGISIIITSIEVNDCQFQMMLLFDKLNFAQSNYVDTNYIDTIFYGHDEMRFSGPSAYDDIIEEIERIHEILLSLP
jgi:hypothetical protein